VKVLVAEDEVISRCVLESALTEWGHDVVAVGDGQAAWQVLNGPEPPRLAVLDWEMPGMVGPEVCRKARALPVAPRPYLLLLTAREGKENIAAGLRAGANDYLSKPFDADELRARIDVGTSLLELESLEATSRELERRVEERTAELAQAHADNERLFAAITAVLIGLDEGGRVARWNKAAADVLGLSAGQALGQPFAGLPIRWADDGVIGMVLSCARENRHIRLKNVPFQRPGRPYGYLDLCLTPVPGGAGARPGVLLLGEDRTEQRHLELQLAQAQKLESIGQLAAGIAHEINTPIQYVSDNITFLQGAFDDLRGALHAYAALHESARSGAPDQEALAGLERALGISSAR
jgi:CheY-like chemotaxis protein